MKTPRKLSCLLAFLAILTVVFSAGCIHTRKAESFDAKRFEQLKKFQASEPGSECFALNFCSVTEEIVVKARCEQNKIASVTKSIDHYFNYLDRDNCLWCKLYLGNDGIEIRTGEQGYCRFDEYASYSEVPDRDNAVCYRDPDKLNEFCARNGTLFLDKWTHRTVLVPCDYYGPVTDFPDDQIVCTPWSPDPRRTIKDFPPKKPASEIRRAD